MKSPLLKNATLLVIMMVLIASCNRESAEERTVEVDYIKYKVNYLEKMAGDIPTNMLPGVMHAYFSNKHVMTKIDGFFGQFSLVQVADLRKQTVTSMLNFFGNKVYYIGNKGEIPVSIYPLDNPEIEFTEDTLRISGLISQKAIVSLPDTEYDIFYTKEIEIKSPNITTPYSFIDYVLSDFRVQLSYLKMRLIIDKHERQTVEASMFEVPEEYVPVSRETMEDIINNLFTKE